MKWKMEYEQKIKSYSIYGVIFFSVHTIFNYFFGLNFKMEMKIF